MITGPTPPSSAQLGFCVMCAIRWKAEVVENPEVAEAIQVALRGDGPVFYLHVPPMVKGKVDPPENAVAYGICPPLNNALVPLCWGHVQGIKFSNIAPADQSMVPLLTGKKR
jgi:hypothetical protein